MKTKICKFQKKEFGDDVYLCCKIKGKLPNKTIAQLRLALNQAVLDVMNPPQPEE